MFGHLRQFEKNMFLAYFIVRIQKIIHITQKCVNQLFILAVRLPLRSTLLSFGELKVIRGFLTMVGVSAL